MPLAPPDLAVRTLERADRTADVLAPRAWSDAQVEAWLDWTTPATRRCRWAAASTPTPAVSASPARGPKP